MYVAEGSSSHDLSALGMRIALGSERWCVNRDVKMMEMKQVYEFAKISNSRVQAISGPNISGGGRLRGWKL